jgi:VTC domain
VPPDPFDRLADFSPVSLDALDERASLQRRVDQKYVVTFEQLDEVLAALDTNHDVLDIDGCRTFDYRSVYFDTPDHRCFVDHVRDRKPRFKLRTRHYVTTDGCVFEVKIKQPDGDMDKKSIDYDGEAADRLTDAARDLLRKSLGTVEIEPPSDLRPTLVTEFRRSTLGMRDGAERTTIDRGLRLRRGDEELRLRDDRALLETKTEDGDGRADRALRAAGVEPVSFSKYRLGIGRLAHPDADPGYADALESAFAPGASATSPGSSAGSGSR